MSHPNDPASFDYRLDPPDDGCEQIEKACESIRKDLDEVIEKLTEMIADFESIAGEDSADELYSAKRKLEELR